jgi:hypothetical protein
MNLPGYDNSHKESGQHTNGHVTANALGSRYGSEQILGKETGNRGLEMHLHVESLVHFF